MNNREAVEKFHLVFLRHFAATASPGTLCLKGGVNLRLYHQSPRLSEDMDFDARKVGVEILKKNVTKVLRGRPLLTELGAAGISVSEINPSKQTATVQRWKFHIIYRDEPISTRLEFSRRGDDEFKGCQAEPPSAALLAERRVVPFVFNHYTAEAAYRQKVHALASRTQVQARDVFDLDHLSPFEQAALGVSTDLIDLALGQLGLITFEMFRDQVVPYLTADLASFYGTAEAWESLSGRVASRLTNAKRNALS